MASSGSKKVVYAAMLANLAIAVMKYVAAAFSGSSAMMAEAVHSTVDTGNELLLLLGIKRSARPPSKKHPYGHGKALYFYALLVAVYIFGLGGCLTIYQGIERMQHPRLPENLAWNYAVLALAAAFDFNSWRIAYRELRSRKDPGESVWDEIIGSKDPTVFTVFLEDSAALLGTAFAAIAIVLGSVFQNPYFDPAASILIGVLLVTVAALIGRETGALLVGERTNRAKIRRIRDVLLADSEVEGVGELSTMQLGPDQVLLTAKIRFRRGLAIEQLEAVIQGIEGRIRQAEPTIQKMFLEADSVG